MSTLADLLNGQSRAGASTSQDKSHRFPNSVLLKLPKFSRDYEPEDFVKALEGNVERAEIRVLGRLKFPNEWTMTLTCEDARERVLQLGHFKVNGKKCVVHPQAENEVRGRVHWLPGEVGDEKIRDILQRFGEVLSFKKEMVYKTNAELRSSVRSFSLLVKPDVKVDDIPHFIKVNSCEGLITIKNRDPICLGCREHGHRKSCCPNSSKKFVSKKSKKKPKESSAPAANETGAKKKKKKKKKAKKKPAETAAATPAVSPAVPLGSEIVSETRKIFQSEIQKTLQTEMQKTFQSIVQQMSEQIYSSALNMTDQAPRANQQTDRDPKANQKPARKEPETDAAGPSNTTVTGTESKRQLVTMPAEIKQENGTKVLIQVPVTGQDGAVGGGNVSAAVIATNNANNDKTTGGGGKKKKNKKKKVRFVAAE